ncbi:MAG: fibronectin type III domain-containing protein [Gemmatimonadota bacterium]|nr:fibronectin type III domain-containing protein [Gemmatimonadota bacterium]
MTYRIAAYDAWNPSNQSEWSSEAHTTVGAGADDVPDAPTNLTATADGSTAIDLSWTAPSDTGTSAITGYRVDYSLNGNAPWSEVGSTNGQTRTFKDTGLNPNTSRHYRVSAQNDAGFGDPSNIARATTEDDDEKEEPRAPRNLRAEADGDSAIDLTWRAPSDDGGSAITRYRVDVSDDNEGWSILVDTAAQITSYKHSGLDPGAKWYYRVRASNSVGSGAWSSVANATTESEDSASVPDAPTDLIAEASGDRIDLDWDAPAENGGSDITGYRIEYSTDGDDWDILETDTETTSTRYRHRGVEPGTKYYYRVRAINDVGRGPASNVASATTDALAPGAPMNLMAKADGSSEVELDWDPPEDDGGSEITGYRIEYSDDGQTWDDLERNTGSTSTSYEHRGITAGTRYYYRVRAINDVGASPPSNEAAATTDASVPDAPEGLAATAIDEGRIDLVWSPPSFDGGSAVTGYRIEYSMGTVNWKVLTENTLSTATTYSHTGLDANTEVTYRIAAINTLGFGAYSNLATATTAATVAGAPRGLNARAVGTDRIDLWWTEPLDDGGSGIEGYRISVSGQSGGFVVLVNHTGTAATSYTHAGLEPGDTWRYQVQAINDAGVGPSSNIATARTDAVVPDAPFNAMAEASGTRAIRVTWEPPTYTGGVDLSGYQIEVHDGTVWTVLVDNHGMSTTYTHSGLDPGEERRYRIRALNEAGQSEPSNVAAARTVPVVPDPPVELEARADGPHRINLEWRAPRYDGGAPITGYEIHVLPDGEDDWRILEPDTRTADTRYSHMNLDPATENRYRVAAINEAGSSYLSAPAVARTDPVVPGPPENLTAAANGSYQIDLDWDRPEYTGGVPVTGYRIEAYDGFAWTTLVTNTRSGSTRYSHMDLEPGSAWRYRVSAINEAGGGEPSEEASAETDAIPPNPPIGLDAEADGPDRIRLEWIAPEYTGGAPIMGYRIEGSRGDAVWMVVAETRTVLTNYVHRGLDPASTWYYRVSAVNRAGASDPSEMAVATTDPIRPDPPTGLRAEANGPYEIDLMWAAPAYTGGTPVSGYQVEVSENAGASWTVLVTDTRSETTAYEHTGIRPGSTRHYRVSAINRAGISDPSSVAFARTEATVPDMPNDLRAVAVDHARIGLSWTPPEFDGGAPVDGYRIEYSEDGAPWMYVDENTQSDRMEYVHEGLMPATTYHYRVSAINEKGAGRATEPVSARTDATVPDAPTDLEAKAIDPRSIMLTWRAPEYDGGAPVAVYQIEASHDGEEWAVLDMTPDTEPEYLHFGLTPGDTWYYRVSAMNEAGTGAPSNIAMATTDDPVERAARVNFAILPRFASAVTAGIVEAVASRAQAVAAGGEGNGLRAGNINYMGARNGGLRDVLNGSGASGGFGGLSTWLGAESVSQADPGGSEVRFDGALFSAHGGADMRLPHNLLAGVALSRSSGSYDWTDVTNGREVEGTYDTRMTSLTPYVAWTPRSGVSVWTAASYGRGDVEIDDELAGTRESTTTMRTGAAGITSRLLGDGSGALKVRAEGWASWMDIEEAEGIEAWDFQIRRVRAVLEWAQLNRFESGHEVGLLINSGARYEMNAGTDDVNGLEVGGGMGYTSPESRFRMQGRGRMLLNMDGDYEEWGVGAVVQIDPGAADGLSLRLNPSYGQAGSGVENLWANGMTARGMDSGRAKLAVHTEYKSGLNPAPYVRAELFGPGRGLWLGTRVRWMALEGTYDRNGPAISAKGVLQW